MATGGAEAVMRFQVAEQEGTVCRQAVLALNPLQIVTFRGHCMEAGPRMRQPLHMPLSLQLKVLAVPGPLLSLCLGASPTEDPTGPSPGPMPKPRPARGLPGGRAEKNPAHRVGEGPLPGPRSSSWNLGGCKPGSLPGQTYRVGDEAGGGTRIRKPTPPLL